MHDLSIHPSQWETSCMKKKKKKKKKHKKTISKCHMLNTFRKMLSIKQKSVEEENITQGEIFNIGVRNVSSSVTYWEKI